MVNKKRSGLARAQCLHHRNQFRSARSGLALRFVLPLTTVLLSFAEVAAFDPAPEPMLVPGMLVLFVVPVAEVLPVASVRAAVEPAAGAVARVFGVTVLPTLFAASPAWVAAEGSVRTKVPVLGWGAAFCMASCAFWGVTPILVAGVAAVCAHVPPAVSDNAAPKAKLFIECFNIIRFFLKN